MSQRKILEKWGGNTLISTYTQSSAKISNNRSKSITYTEVDYLNAVQ